MQVDIITTDASNVPVSGAAVTVFDSAANYSAGAITDVNGRVRLDLAGSVVGLLYNVYVFKIGIGFDDPFEISVVEPGPATFTFAGVPVNPFGVPTDPYLCRCVGRFLDYQNRPKVNISVRISANVDLLNKIPKIAGGSFISPSSMEFRTDSNGYVVADLIRSGEYYVAFAGEEDEVWGFKVPDAQTANLTDLVHPRPIAVSYSGLANNAISIVVGERLSVPVTMTFTDKIDRPEEISRWAEFLISDPTIMDVTFDAGMQVMTFRGLNPGVATLTVNTKLNFPATLPATTISAPVITVTVSP